MHETEIIFHTGTYCLADSRNTRDVN